jgi:multiple sugar transport system permease protein
MRTNQSLRLNRKELKACSSFILLVFLSIMFILPFYWTLSTALKHPSQVLRYPIVWIPNPPQWSNFAEAWNSGPFALYFRNTTYIAVFATVGTVLSCSLVAFGFARIPFPGRDFLFVVLLSTMMVPGAVREIPMYLLFRNMGWLNTFKPLIVPSYFAASAFSVFLLRQFFLTLPTQLEEAAIIDGCNYFTVWWRIFVPLSKPGMATVGIFSFIEHWNVFMTPLIYLRDRDKYTISLALRLFADEDVPMYHHMMAMSFLAMLPLLLIFFLAQRYFIEGIALTGLKE